MNRAAQLIEVYITEATKLASARSIEKKFDALWAALGNSGTIGRPLALDDYLDRYAEEWLYRIALKLDSIEQDIEHDLTTSWYADKTSFATKNKVSQLKMTRKLQRKVKAARGM